MISCKDVREPASGSQREAGIRTYKLRSRFNGRRRWPLHVRCRRKKFTFAISSPDEFLYKPSPKYPKGISIGSATLQGSRSWQTDKDRQTDHATPSVTVGLGHVYVYSTAMRPNNTYTTNSKVRTFLFRGSNVLVKPVCVSVSRFGKYVISGWLYAWWRQVRWQVDSPRSERWRIYGRICKTIGCVAQINNR